MILRNYPRLKFWLKRFIEIITGYRIRYHIPPWDKQNIIFTFDDGPLPNTLDVLDLLDECGKKAMFFLVAEQVRANPQIAREVVKRGHSIGSHGFSHINMKELSLVEFSRQVKQSLKIIEEVCGVKPKYFRPPFRQIGFFQTIWLLIHGLILYSCSCGVSESGKLNFINPRFRRRLIVLLHDYLPLNVIKIVLNKL